MLPPWSETKSHGSAGRAIVLPHRALPRPLLQDVDLRMSQTQVEIQISHPETFPLVVMRLDTTVRMKRVK